MDPQATAIWFFVPGLLLTFQSWWIDSVLKRTLQHFFVRRKRTTRACVISELGMGMRVTLSLGIFPYQRPFRAELTHFDPLEPAPQSGQFSLGKLRFDVPLHFRLIPIEPDDGQIVDWSRMFIASPELHTRVGMVRRALNPKNAEGRGTLIVEDGEIPNVLFAASIIDQE